MDVRGQCFCRILFCFILLLNARAYALELNGVAPFSELGEEMYLAGLYLNQRSTDPAAFFSHSRERKMEVRFSSSISRRRWVNSWMQSIAINNSRDHLEVAVEELAHVLSTFEGNLFRGDRVEIHYLPADGTELRVNDHVLASGHSAEVFDLFLSSWIGPVPPNSQFRSLLLGQEDASDSHRFMMSQPALERIEAVAAWGTAMDADDVAPESEPALEAVSVAPAAMELSADLDSDSLTLESPSLAAVPAAPVPTETVTVVDSDMVPAPISAEEPMMAATETPADIFFEEEEEEPDLSVTAILGQRDYMSQIIRDVYSNIRYPERALRRNYEGSVRMRLIIERDGSLAEVKVMEGSRHDTLNEEAGRAVLAAVPFAPIPNELRGERIEVELPINFRLE